MTALESKYLWVKRLTRTKKSMWLGVVNQEDAGYVLGNPEFYPEVYQGTREQIYRLAGLRDYSAKEEGEKARASILSQMTKIR